MTTATAKKAAKDALDKIISKSRVHLYKPIQIAEILHHHRTNASKPFSLNDLESYRSPSKKWRDDVCQHLLGRICTSSAKFQDNLFEKNAIPPSLLSVLGEINKADNGIVEAYIYQAFEEKHCQLESALEYCTTHSTSNFDLNIFLDKFWQQPGLKRSIDKVFEIVVYSLFEVLTQALKVKVDIYYDHTQVGILTEFSGFAEKVLNLKPNAHKKTLDAHFYRVGVTNAADRGLDIFANFGAVVQIKHLSLNEEMAESVVTSISADKVIIVCKNAEKKIITSLLNQIGWKSRIQSIITIDELANWYEIALRGEHAKNIGNKVLTALGKEIKKEFPSLGAGKFSQFKMSRGYHQLNTQRFTF